MTPELGPPIDVLHPSVDAVPLVVSSPHSGQIYPPSLLGEIAVGPAELRRLEDGCVDRLFDCAPALGAPLLRARFARAYVDPNREAFELDAALFDHGLPGHVNASSTKARAGLGTVPSRIGGLPIYRGALSFAEVEQRIRLAYWPYHLALQRLIARSLAEFGVALLLDCHSMPRQSAEGDDGALIDVALGDRYGRSCATTVVDHAERLLRGLGLTVARNRPYAGGYITARYGQPKTGVHALQIEIRRDLYMDETTLEPDAGLDQVRPLLRALLAHLAEVVTTRLAGPSEPLVRYPTAS